MTTRKDLRAMVEPRQGPEKPDGFSRFSSLIERSLKLAVAFVAIAYVFGIVVLNVHLSRYGYHSLGLLQLDYVVAGLWSLFPVILTCLLIFIYFYFRFESSLFDGSQSKTNVSVEQKLTQLIAAGVACLLTVLFIFWYFEIDFAWSWVVAGLVGFFITAGIVVFPIGIAAEENRKDRILLAVMLIWCLIFLPFYLVYFGRNVYQTIPDTSGGGKGTKAVLVAKDAAAQSLLEAVGARFAENRKSAPVRLIRSTDKEMIIALESPPENQPGMKGVRLDAGLVSAILYGR